MSKRDYRGAQRNRPLGEAGLAEIRKIAKSGYAKVNEVLVDSFSASGIVAIYDALNPANQAKLLAMPVGQVCEVCFKLINRSKA